MRATTGGSGPERPARVTASAAAVLLVGALLFAACSPGVEVEARTGEAEAVPALPERFGFGSPADEARIAVWDIDVRPDGTGLPAGSGTIAQGEDVYRARCMACHGPTGTEGPNNRLVGTGSEWADFPASYAVGDYWPYATTLFDYIRRAMPLDEPGALSADETYAVIAWILHRNGIVGEDAVMNESTLPRVDMPARDRFVPDDRLESAQVR